MPPRFERDDAAARCALDEALLDEKRLDHVLERVARLRQRRRQRLDAHRPALVVSSMTQILAVHLVEPRLVDLERGER